METGPGNIHNNTDLPDAGNDPCDGDAIKTHCGFSLVGWAQPTIYRSE